MLVRPLIRFSVKGIVDFLVEEVKHLLMFFGTLDESGEEFRRKVVMRVRKRMRGTREG